MKIIISVASVLASAFSLGAQITATINRLPQGLEEIRIRNNSAISLVAFAVYAKQLTLERRSLRDTLAAERGNPSGIAASYTPHLVYFDAIQPETRPLPPGEESVVMARGPALPDRHFFEEPIVTAGIFADGTTSGDAALLRRLILRRCNMLQAVEASLETLSDAGRRNVPRDQLIRQFKKMADSVRHWYLPPEQQVGLRVYQPIIGKLINLPEVETGAPFPPASFVAQETAMLNRQRVTLLESQHYLADAALIGR